MNKKDLALTINSDTFTAMKNDFDKVLTRTLSNMLGKESEDATITLKLSISLREDEAPDFEATYPNAIRAIQKPRFDHKISSVMQIKTEESGSLKGEYELIWDKDKGDYVMRPIDNGQQSLFDDDAPVRADKGDNCIEVDYVDVTEDTDDETPAIGDGNVKCLPSRNEEAFDNAVDSLAEDDNGEIEETFDFGNDTELTDEELVAELDGGDEE